MTLKLTAGARSSEFWMVALLFAVWIVGRFAILPASDTSADRIVFNVGMFALAGLYMVCRTALKLAGKR